MPCALLLSLALAACGGGGGGGSAEPVVPPAPPVNGPAWWGFGRDAQHSALAGTATQPLSRIVWQTKIDLMPRFAPNGNLLIHYGSPVITARNTVLVPIKTGATGGFRLEARSGSNGAVAWSADSDYVLPAHDWTPGFNVALTPGNRVYMPGAGGKLYYRDNADTAAATVQTVVFYGAGAYQAAQGQYDASVFINTPLTTDTQGNVYFGFVVTAPNPAGLASGIARIGTDGVGTWVAATSASGNPAITKPAMNAAPALSQDQQTLYVVLANNPPAGERPFGYLLALDPATLALKSKVLLTDPKTGAPGWISDNGTASPAVGPDGDVYYGILEFERARAQLPRMAAALQRGIDPDEGARVIRLGRHAVVHRGRDGALVCRSGVVSRGDQVQQLWWCRYRRRQEPHGGPRSQPGPGRLHLRQPGDARSPDDPRPDGGPGLSRRRARVVHQHGRGRSFFRIGAGEQRGRHHLPLEPCEQHVHGADPVQYRIGEAYTPTAVGADGTVYAINNTVLFAVGK